MTSIAQIEETSSPVQLRAWDRLWTALLTPLPVNPTDQSDNNTTEAA